MPDPRAPPPRSGNACSALKVEGLIVEAKRLGLTLDDVQTAVEEHWRLLAHKEA